MRGVVTETVDGNFEKNSSVVHNYLKKVCEKTPNSLLFFQIAVGL